MPSFVDSVTLTYSIVGAADAAHFKIDGQTGALSFVTVPKLRGSGGRGGDNVYDVVVRPAIGRN